MPPELAERDRVRCDRVASLLRRIGEQREHVCQRRLRLVRVTIGKQRRERGAEDVLRTRTPEATEQPSEDPDQRLDVHVLIAGLAGQQVERGRIQLVAEVEQHHVLSPLRRNPLHDRFDRVALRLHVGGT